MTTDAAREMALAEPAAADREAELIRLAKAGSPQAWTQIYELNHPRLFRYVLARVGDRHLAEDLTATVFLEAVESIGSYASRGRPLLAWLYAIARNTVNYHHRAAFRRRDILGASMSLLSQLRAGGKSSRELGTPAPPAGALGDPASRVERWDMEQAINRLPADQREVILLRYFIGLTTPETARVLGKHERAVYSLQARAIKALRGHLSWSGEKESGNSCAGGE